MVHTRARAAALRDEIMRNARASKILARGAVGCHGRRSPRLAAHRLGAICSQRLARFNRKIAKYNYCQLIGDITPRGCLEKILSLANDNVEIIAANSSWRAGIHNSVRVMRLLAPDKIDRVNRLWRSVKHAARHHPSFSY
jgi:hypothetical protein